MTQRKSEYPILDSILNRWSPRAMSGKKIPFNDLMTIFEAGRWAPSSYNNQPWHFIYALRDTPAWDVFLNLLVPFNREWSQQAAALVCVISAKNFIATGKPSRTHLFDAGAAWENMAIQAVSMGLVIHGMEGFDYEKTRTNLHVPDSYDIIMMFALGYPAPSTTLSTELQKREVPSDRISLEQIVSEGTFKSTRIIKQ